jgi:hypothetical protein
MATAVDQVVALDHVKGAWCAALAHQLWILTTFEVQPGGLNAEAVKPAHVR